jgi:hypothetical protein
MKQTALFVLLIAFTHTGFTRVNSSNQDNFPPAVYTDTSLTGISSINDILADIISVTGLKAGFELKEAKVLNIEASISHKKRMILYNPSFINWVNHATQDKWGVVALLAHEVGHHLNGHTIRKTGSTPKEELEADEFAGFVLNKLGASLVEAQEVMMYIAGDKASSSHPSRTSRMEAIRNGWNKAAKISA